MYRTYDMRCFASKLKKIRESMNYTLVDVSISTGINVSTIRQMENFKTIPRIDTLYILSSFYKCDLIMLLHHNTVDFLCSELFHLIAKNSINGDTIELNECIDKLRLYINESCLSPVEIKDLTQFQLYTEGLLFASECKKDEFNEAKDALNKYADAIRIKNNLFNFENIESFKYNTLEYYILYSAAVVFEHMKEYKLSNRILILVLNHLNHLNNSLTSHKQLIAKVQYLISYNFHSQDIHHKAFEFASNGIEFCLSNDTHFYLPLLLSRKGIAQKNLHIPEWRSTLNDAITLLKLQNRPNLVEIIEKFIYSHSS